MNKLIYQKWIRDPNSIFYKMVMKNKIYIYIYEESSNYTGVTL